MALSFVRIIFIFFLWSIFLSANLNSHVIINELHPAPVGGEPEWIELFNSSDSTIILHDNLISNINTTKPLPEINIPAKGFVVLTSDTLKLQEHRKIPATAQLVKASLPVLHNTSDPVVFRNNDSTVIDSVYYDVKWGVRGISFERVDWSKPAVNVENLKPSESPDSATAGYANSLSSGASPIISYPRGCIQINEFLYDAGKYNAEFVELWNSTDDAINLRGWQFHDNPDKSASSILTFGACELTVQPKGYAVIAWDSALFVKFPELKGLANVLITSSGYSLSNTGDDIILADRTGETIDSLSYTPQWHVDRLTGTKDISLEKINTWFASCSRSFWSSCGDKRGATPARDNSIMQVLSGFINLSAEPNPFSAYGANAKTACIISYQLPFRNSWIDCRIFNPEGNQVAGIANNQYSAATGELEWNGRNSNGDLLPVGQYVLLLVASDAASDDVSEGKLILVIGE